jgi:hypothetical protein
MRRPAERCWFPQSFTRVLPLRPVAAFHTESSHSALTHIFSTVRRGVRNLLVKKSDKEIGAAATAEDADDGVDDPLDGTALAWMYGFRV